MIESVNFSWSPVSVPLVYTVGGDTFPYSTQYDGISRASDSRYVSYTTRTHQLLTFVADVVLNQDSVPVEYKWDFGDGVAAFGPSVTHEYLVANPQTQVTLTIRDNRSHTKSRTQIINLRTGQPITVGLGLRV